MTEDPYVLPADDAYYSTLEGYKRYLSRPVDAYWQASAYRQYGARLEQWQQCCPEKQREVARLLRKTPIRNPF